MDAFSEKLEEFYEEVDTRAESLSELHSARLNCRKGCSSCCVDEITVFRVEADHIRERHAHLLESGVPHPPGACAFLDDEGACRIYEDRPYVCRTQGLPLRWFDELEGQTVEFRDICPLNEEGPQPVEELEPDDCWTIGEFESRLAAIEVSAHGGTSGRIPLRSLFRSPSDCDP